MDVERLRTVLHRHPVAADLALATAVLVFTVVTQLLLVVPEAAFAPPTPLLVAWAAVLVAPLAARRRFPVGVLVLTGIHFVGYWAVGQVNELGSWVVLGIAVYSAAAHGRRPLAARVCVAMAVLLAVVSVSALLVFTSVTPAAGVATVLFNEVPFVLAWPLGSMVRSLRGTRATLVERNRQLTEERRSNARRAIVEERMRIARELHDVVAHHVSVIGVQAGVARRLFDRAPEQAAEAIAAVEQTSRQTIDELHQIVGFLRAHDDEELTPQPDLEQLPGLLQRMRDAGLPVVYVVEGRPRRWPAAVELSAFRIVQEALTNVLKHAGVTATTVTVRHGGDGLEIEVVDEGRRLAAVGGRDSDGARAATAAAARDGASGGKGLLGMRERAGMHGGRLEAGPLPERGFRVHATLHDTPPGPHAQAS